MAKAAKKGGIRLGLAWLVFLAAVALPVWFIAAGLGSKYGLWGWQFGLGKMTFAWGPMLTIGVLGAAVLTLLLGLIAAPRIKTVILSMLALVVAGLVMGQIIQLGKTAENLPPIHDVQTDWSDPVRFSDAIMAERAKVEGVNPVEDDPVIIDAANGRWPGMGGRRVAEVQAEKYEPLQTMIRDVTPEQMYTAAYLSMTEMGIEPVLEDEETFRIEGTYTSKWFGFKDDVAIRIRAKGEGSEMDIRSTSRVGLSDLGANIERVHSLIERVDGRLAQLKS